MYLSNEQTRRRADMNAELGACDEDSDIDVAPTAKKSRVNNSVKFAEQDMEDADDEAPSDAMSPNQKKSVAKKVTLELFCCFCRISLFTDSQEKNI